MEDSLGLGLLALAALVLGIVALSKLSHLVAAIEELKRRLSKLEGGSEVSISKTATPKSSVPPPLPSYVTKSQMLPQVAPPAKPQPAFNWESILGVKLFAWIGGFALFLGVVFFVKYAFDNNWITPAMRIIAGAAIGLVLIAVSLLPKVRRYHIPAQSVCAAGILILYADIYAAHALYYLVSLTATTALMWIVTAIALGLAYYLTAQTVAWLAIVGGFVTPSLLRIGFYTNPVFLVTYIVILDCGVAAIARLKRWTYLLSVAAFLSVLLLAAWANGPFGRFYEPAESHVFYLIIEGLFLCLCIGVTWQKELDNWIVVAMGIAGLGALIGITAARISHPIDLMLWLVLGNAGIIAFVSANRRFVKKELALALIAGLAFLGTCFVEWLWCNDVLDSWQHLKGILLSNDRGVAEAHAQIGLIIFRHVLIFLLYAAVPYLVGTKRVWPWMIAAIAAPIHFALVYAYLESPAHLVSHELFWCVPLAFAVPAAIGVWFLVKKEYVELSSGDTRLATQGAAVLALISFVFPVQFHREWITLGWAIEGLLLILLFRWIPNRRLRAVALIVFSAAFVRLVLNPAVLEYHPRTHVPVWNWYLYAYGIASVCFFLGARRFGEPRERQYERHASTFLYSLSGICLFLLMNIEIADYFSIGPTLTFSFSGNFARDMTYTIAWSLFAFGLLVLGIKKSVRGLRLVAIGLLLVAFAKLFLHDLDSLQQLYRIIAFIAVAIIAIVASFVYQRFLMPRTKV